MIIVNTVLDARWRKDSFSFSFSFSPAPVQIALEGEGAPTAPAWASLGSARCRHNDYQQVIALPLPSSLLRVRNSRSRRVLGGLRGQVVSIRYRANLGRRCAARMTFWCKDIQAQDVCFCLRLNIRRSPRTECMRQVAFGPSQVRPKIVNTRAPRSQASLPIALPTRFTGDERSRQWSNHLESTAAPKLL